MLFDQPTTTGVRTTSRRRSRRSAALALAMIAALGLALSACSYDPWRQAGRWRPDKANAANLRAMIAQPSDLKSGEPATGARGASAAHAVSAMLAGTGPSFSGGRGGGGSAASSGMTAGGGY